MGKPCLKEVHDYLNDPMLPPGVKLYLFLARFLPLSAHLTSPKNPLSLWDKFKDGMTEGHNGRNMTDRYVFVTCYSEY